VTVEDTSKATLELIESLPPKARTVGMMRALAEELDAQALRAKQIIVAKFASKAAPSLPGLLLGNPLAMLDLLSKPLVFENQVQSALKDLTEARVRAGQYKAALAGLPEDSLDLPDKVLPLFLNLRESEVQTLGLEGRFWIAPDYLAPVYALNKFEAASEVADNMLADLLGYVAESAVDLLEKGRKAAEKAFNVGPYILGGAAAIALVVALKR